MNAKYEFGIPNSLIQVEVPGFRTIKTKVLSLQNFKCHRIHSSHSDSVASTNIFTHVEFEDLILFGSIPYVMLTNGLWIMICGNLLTPARGGHDLLICKLPGPYQTFCLDYLITSLFSLQVNMQ